MKVRNLFEFLGFKSKPRHYPYELAEFDLNDLGIVRYAQWKHPSESSKVITSELVDQYRTYVKEGDFCIDVGAHTGDTSLPIGLAAGQEGCVLALEPNPYVYHVLEKNARANAHLANVIPMMAAAGKENGFMEFEYSDSGFCNGGRHENISFLDHGHAYKQEVFSIDLERELRSDFQAFLPKLSFLKVDAEGFDLYVLLSLKEIIREFRPVIKAEVFKRTGTKYREDLMSFFEKLDYAVHKIKSDPVEKGEELKKEDLLPGTHYDVLALPN